MRSCLCLAVACIVVFLGIEKMRDQWQELDVPDQIKAVALFHYLKSPSLADKSRDLKDKLDALTREIKRRWNMTPEELSRFIHSRFRITPKSCQRRVPAKFTLNSGR
jgi:hypothetical protein